MKKKAKGDSKYVPCGIEAHRHATACGAIRCRAEQREAIRGEGLENCVTGVDLAVLESMSEVTCSDDHIVLAGDGIKVLR